MSTILNNKSLLIEDTDARMRDRKRNVYLRIVYEFNYNLESNKLYGILYHQNNTVSIKRVRFYSIVLNYVGKLGREAKAHKLQLLNYESGLVF